MTAAFDFDVPPFDTLNAAQQALVRATASLVQFAPDDPVLTPEMEPTHAYLLVAGHVRREASVLPEATYGAGTLFGARALLAARATSTSMALDEVTAWQIPKATLQSLLSSNPAFCAAVFAEIARRLSKQEARSEQREFLSLMMSRVRDAYVRKPFYVDGALDLVTRVCADGRGRPEQRAGARRRARRHVHHHRPARCAAAARRAAASRYLPPQAVAVRDVARFELISVNADGELFEALLLMIRHRVHRVLVRDGAAIVGVLSQLDLMSFVSNHSHIIALQIEQAECVADLKAAALQMDGLVSLLHGGGVKVEVISSMVRVLNAQVFARLWSFVAPAELVRQQLPAGDGQRRPRRADPEDRPGQRAAAARRLCLRRPAGHRRKLQHRADRVRLPALPGRHHADQPAVARAAGRVPPAHPRLDLRRRSRWADAPGDLHGRGVGGRRPRPAAPGQAVHARGAARQRRLPGALCQRGGPVREPAGWWARLTAHRGRDEQLFDLKKLGTFPIVHGVRSLALQSHIGALGTAERVRALVDARQLDADLARDLVEALHFLMGLKLRNNLAQRQLGQPVDNLVRMSAMSTLERDRLKESLAIVKRFRQHLQQHFKLGAL